MELDIKPRTGYLNNGADGTKTSDSLPLNLYKSVPAAQLTLEECEDLFRQRLEAYHIFESTAESKTAYNGPDIINQLRAIKSYVYKTNCIVVNRTDKQAQRFDQLSHMLMRMFCVYRSDLWSWFRVFEKRLFASRLRDQAGSLSGAQFESILHQYNFTFRRAIGDELSELLKEKLIGWGTRDPEKGKGDIFKVKFVNALRFVANRSVALKDGFALLTKHDMISVVADAFERHLDNELMYARQHLRLDDAQAKQLIDSMSLVYQDFKDRVEEQRRLKKRNANENNKRPFAIEIQDIEDLVKNHFPPCMRYLHETLQTDHHLKHSGRLHYGTFLRSGQVDLDTAIEFWRKEFTKKIPNDKFERDYKYNIRHLYGKEGSNKDGLTCFSCDKIIKDNPGPSEKHGCPFQHFDEAHLRAMLTKHGLKSVDIESIVAKKTSEGARAGCSAYFQYSKGYELPDLIKNPIQFYYESRRVANRPIKLEEITESVDPALAESHQENDDPAMEFDD